MSRIAFSLAAAFVLISSSAQAQDAEQGLTVAEFLEIWGKIDMAGIQKDMEATGTFDRDKYPNAKRATVELERVAKAYRAQVEADRKAGRKAHSCLPEGEAEVSTAEMLPHLEAFEPAGRGAETMDVAFAELMLKTYPCD